MNTTSTAEMKAQNYYRSCMDEGEIIEHLGPKPLVDLIDTVSIITVYSLWEGER